MLASSGAAPADRLSARDMGIGEEEEGEGEVMGNTLQV